MVPVLATRSADQSLIERTINANAYAMVYQLNPDEIVKDGASIDAFKRYLDSKLLNPGVIRVEAGTTIIYAMDHPGGQETSDNLTAPAVRLEYQPWFERYFTRIFSYEKGSKTPEDIFLALQVYNREGWVKHIAKDDFYPKQ